MVIGDYETYSQLQNNMDCMYHRAFGTFAENIASLVQDVVNNTFIYDPSEEKSERLYLKYFNKKYSVVMHLF
jgi:hypothetical protein